MEIPDALGCVFTGSLEQDDGDYVIEVPEQEIKIGPLTSGGTYRVAIFQREFLDDEDDTAPPRDEPDDSSAHQPRVEPGDTRVVEIETLGEQGDGIARIDRGLVLIVPAVKPGDRIRAEITRVRESVAFGVVVERLGSAE